MHQSQQKSRLSPREYEIAEAYATGETYQQIAGRLFIAPSTVRTHLAAIYRKLGVSSKIELHKVIDGSGAAQTLAQDESAAIISELALSLEEAISRERALGEVLRIISRSQGEIGEVIAAVLRYALELCDAEFGILFEYNAQSGYRAAYTKNIPEPFDSWLTEQGAFHVSPATGLGRIMRTQEVVHIADVRAERIYRDGDPLRYATADLGGARSFAAIPMLAGDRLIGAFTVYRKQVRPFGSRSLDLARIFADQSVVAIENARRVDDRRQRF